MKLNKESLSKIYSPRAKFIYEDGLYKILSRKDNEYIGFIKEIYDGQDLIIEFDIDEKYKNKGYQTEALREYLRYKYLWEKDCDKIICYPILQQTKKVLEKRFFVKENDKYFITKDIYMSRIERLTLFDEDIKRLSHPNHRGEEILEHTYVGVVNIIIKNKRNNKYLTTKRDINKATSPGLWEITGGAIDFGEEIEHALIRESKEETGLDILEYHYLDTIKMTELVFFMYLGIVDSNEDDVILQKGETIDYKWRTKDEFIELYNSDLVQPKQAQRIKKIIDKI